MFCTALSVPFQIFTFATDSSFSKQATNSLELHVVVAVWNLYFIHFFLDVTFGSHCHLVHLHLGAGKKWTSAIPPKVDFWYILGVFSNFQQASLLCKHGSPLKGINLTIFPYYYPLNPGLKSKFYSLIVIQSKCYCLRLNYCNQWTGNAFFNPLVIFLTK